MSDILHIVYRSLIAITTLFLLTRILGKKQISQLTFFEYITGIALGELAGIMSTDIEGNLWHGITAVIVWFSVTYLIEFITMKSKRARNVFEGKSRVFIENGKVLEDNLRKEKFTSDELMEQLRVKNVFNFKDVKLAMLEASGELSVMLHEESAPVTPKQLGMKVNKQKGPEILIADGIVLKQALSKRGLSPEWLNKQLEKLGVNIDSIFLGQVDENDELFVDQYDDRIQPGRFASRIDSLLNRNKH